MPSSVSSFPPLGCFPVARPSTSVLRLKKSRSKFNRWKLLFLKITGTRAEPLMWSTPQQASDDKSPLSELWRSWLGLYSATGKLTGNPPVGALPAPSALSAHVCTREHSSVILIPYSHSLNIATRHKTPVSLPDLNKNQQCYSLENVISMYDFTGQKLIFLRISDAY